MPILNPHSLEFISRSPEQTRRAGMRLGALLQPGDTVHLIGDLGSGKTTLVQGIANGWGSLDPVSSPTFVLVNVYRRPNGQRLYHLDAYRLSGALEAEDLDLDALMTSGPLVIEWADKIEAALPPECLQVHMKWVDDGQRDMIISAHGAHFETLLLSFRRQVYGVS
jgi:tRNA threonylcarbamoyladenosine biosynthesis protein TsaE